MIRSGALLAAAGALAAAPTVVGREDGQAVAPQPAQAQPSAETLHDSGVSLLRRRAVQEAAGVLEQAVDNDADNHLVRMDLARAYRSLGRLDDARRQYLAVLSLSPDYEPALVSLGYLARQVGKLDESVYWFERGAAFSGGWYNHVRLAVTYTDLGNLVLMRQAADQIGGSPFKDALREALKLQFERRFDRLLPLAESRLQDVGDEELWRSIAASSAVLVGEYEKAAAHYMIAAPEFFGDDPQVPRGKTIDALWVAFLLKEIGDPGRAAALIDGAMANLAPPEDGDDWVYNKVYRMAAHAIAGRHDEALREFRAAVDQGSRTILFERFVRYEEAPMFRDLRSSPEFQAILDEIKADNARMLAAVIRGDHRVETSEP